VSLQHASIGAGQSSRCGLGVDREGSKHHFYSHSKPSQRVMAQTDGVPPPPPSSSEDSAVLDACARAAEQYYSPRRGRAKTIDGELLHAMRSAIQNLPDAATRAARRSITGDPEMRIRDRAREAFVRPKRPSVVRAVDKALFTGAVGWILLTEYVVLCYPKLLGLLYVSTMTPLLIYRAMDYYFVRHWTYFMFVRAAVSETMQLPSPTAAAGAKVAFTHRISVTR
jgi:hypothetical protein